MFHSYFLPISFLPDLLQSSSNNSKKQTKKTIILGIHSQSVLLPQLPLIQGSLTL